MNKPFPQPHECPACGAEHTHVSGVNVADAPILGDISVCIRCGSINEFAANMKLLVVPALACASPDMYDARRAQSKIREMNGLPYVRVA